MAEAEEPVKSLRTSLSCSICWEIFTDPLATPCGHSYCQKCIHEYWDRQELKLEPINCPICRKEFPKRPEPQKNVSLCKAVEDLKAHEKKRRLVTPENTDTREKGTRTECQRHSRDLTLYCRTERRCICGKCCLTCCLNHDKEDIEDECQQQKNALLTDLQSSDHQKVNTENQIEKWDCKTKEIKDFYDTAEKGVVTAFDKVRSMLEECQALVIDSIRCEERAAAAEASTHLQHLHQYLDELNKYSAEAEKLVHASPVVFLENRHHLAELGSFPVSPDIQLTRVGQMDAVTKVLPKVTRLLQEDLLNALHPAIGPAEPKETSRKSYSLRMNDQCCPREASEQCSEPQIDLYCSPPKMSDIRARLHQDYKNLTFDPETANKYFELSRENLRAAHKRRSSNNVPNSPNRFLTWQVMCSEGFSEGSHYWEVEVSTFFAHIGVAYGSLKRTKDKENIIGKNSQSWSLELRSMHHSAWHNNQEVVLRTPMYKRIGVHLDFPDDSLTFYGVTGEGGLERLHVFQCLFIEKVYPVFFIGEDINVKIFHFNHTPLENI